MITSDPREIVFVFAIIAAVALLMFLIAGFSGDLDFKTKDPSFALGTISNTGEINKDLVHSVYTKKIIKCIGFQISREFDYEVKYTVHYYDADSNWIGCNSYDQGSLIVNEGEMPDGAVGIRIVVESKDVTNGYSLWDRWTLDNHLKIKIMKRSWTKTYFGWMKTSSG